MFSWLVLSICGVLGLIVFGASEFMRRHSKYVPIENQVVFLGWAAWVQGVSVGLLLGTFILWVAILL